MRAPSFFAQHGKRPVWILLLGAALVASCTGPGTSQKSEAPSVQSVPRDTTDRYLPHRDLGPLFEAVQLGGIFEDSKTFVDMRPLAPPGTVAARYRRHRADPDFELAAFVDEQFAPPRSFGAPATFADTLAMAAHLKRLWPHLTRESDDSARYSSSLLPLPRPYVVPGGRFREVYYWDSYFTMLGLAASGREDLIRSMTENFAHLIRTVGFIPNGNRSYYLTRSQPPFFSQMVMLLAEVADTSEATAYLDALKREHAFWMAGQEEADEVGEAVRHVVRLADGTVLNRYWDRGRAPRPESYREDYELAQQLPPEERPRLWRDLRSAAESGWDFSSRWMRDPPDLATTHTTDIVPVDLNALLYAQEEAIAALHAARGEAETAQRFRRMAEARARALRRYCWDEERGFFYDYDFRAERRTDAVTLAAAYPLHFGIATPVQAAQVADRIEQDLLGPGGFVTSTRNSDQQWDAPNGWPPLQWLTIQGLRRYGHEDLAATGRQRWLTLNRRVYRRTGRMVEKYDVLTMGREAGGGEYPTQDGFGWTNGVALALMEEATGE